MAAVVDLSFSIAPLPRSILTLKPKTLSGLISRIREEQTGMSVVVAIAYMDKAQRFVWLVAMDAGQILATGTPADLLQRTGTSSLDDAFIALMPEENVDATRMSQAFVGSNSIQQMTMDEVNEFTRRRKGTILAAVGLFLRARFNPNLEQAWFGSLMEIINNVTLLSIILTGAALATQANSMPQFGMMNFGEWNLHRNLRRPRAGA